MAIVARALSSVWKLWTGCASAVRLVADEFDDVRREVGEVADGFVFDFSVFAEGAAQEVGLVDLALIAPCGGGYMNGAVSFLHGGIIWQFWRQCSLNTLNLSGYILQSMFFR